MNITWKQKQEMWKRAIDNSPLNQSQFAEKYQFDRVSLNNWLNGHTRASPDNELKMDKIINDSFYQLRFED